MSTYNGAKYLKEQLNTILSQKDIDCKLLIRDDGSSDRTIEILNSYQDKKLLTWYKGKNLGPAKSFMQLLSDTQGYEYYAFSDQDDYWLDNKLSSALQKMDNKSDRPILYFCQTQPVDENLNKLAMKRICPNLTFGESLVYEYANGCTMVFNEALRKALLSYSPKFFPMHDYWIITCALAINADVIFDKEPYLLYRQHVGNVIGSKNDFLSEWKKRISRIINKDCSRSRMAMELFKGYGDLMDSNNKALLLLYIEAKKDFSKRLRLLFDNRYRCSDLKTWIFFKLAVLFNTY